MKAASAAILDRCALTRNKLLLSTLFRAQLKTERLPDSHSVFLDSSFLVLL